MGIVRVANALAAAIICQYTLARGKVKILEEMLLRTYHHQHSMKGRHKGTSIDVTGRKYSSVDLGTRQETEYGGATSYVIV